MTDGKLEDAGTHLWPSTRCKSTICHLGFVICHRAAICRRRLHFRLPGRGAAQQVEVTVRELAEPSRTSDETLPSQRGSLSLPRSRSARDAYRRAPLPGPHLLPRLAAPSTPIPG